jgi:hypothetical protein
MKKIILVFFLYLVLSIALTYPLVFNMKNSLPGVTPPGDQLFNIWVFSWEKHAFFNKDVNFWDANIFYPVKNALLYSDYNPGIFFFTLPLLSIFHDPILVCNLLFILMAVCLSGFFMYLLVLYFTKNHFASFVAGLIFTFSPYRFGHLNHFKIHFIFYFPLIILFLDRYLRNRKLKDLICFVIFFVLQFLVSSYLAFYLVFLVGIYILGFYLIKKEMFHFPSFIKLILALMVAGLMIFPFIYPYIKAKKEIGLARPIFLIQESAPTPKDFFSIGFDNKLYNFLRSKGWFPPVAQFDAEKQLFFGFGALFLSIIGLFIKNRLKWLFLAVTLFAMIVSLGPYYHTGSRYVKMPYFYLYQYLPGFSGLNFSGRLTNLTIFGVSVLAGWGILVIIDQFKKKWLKALVGVMVLSVIFSEIFSPPISTAKVKTKQEFAPVYYWLAEQPGDFAIIEFPFWNGLESERMYYSTLHWKKLYNGFSSFFPSETLKLVEVFKKFPAPETLQEIKNSKAKYFIVHLDEYPKDFKDYLDKNLPPQKVFGNDYLYSII